MRAFVRLASLPWMVLALGLYVSVHTPLSDGAWITPSAMWRGIFAMPGEGMFLPPALDAAVVIGAVLAAVAAASVVSAGFTGPAYERPLVFGVVAFAFVAIPAAYVGAWAGWAGQTQLRPPLGPLLVSLPAVVVTATGVLRGWRPARPGLRREDLTGLPLIVAMIAVTLLALSSGLGALRPPTGFDALSFHAPMAVYFWRDGNILTLLDRAPWGFALAHPGSAELWFGLLLSGLGERGANLGQLPFALLGGAAVHAFSRRLGFARRPAVVAGLAFLIAPMVVLQAGIQVNDLVAASLLMTGLALAAAPRDSDTPFRAAMIGLAAGLAVTVKLAVLPGAAALLAFAAITSSRSGTRWPAVRARTWIPLAVAFTVAVAPWAARNAARFGNPLFPAALPVLGRGVVVGDFGRKDTRFVPSAAAWPVYPLIEEHSDDSGLGPLFLIGAGPGLLAAGWRRRWRPVTLYAVVSATSIAAWWELTAHEPRHLLAVLGLAFSFLPGALHLIPRRVRGAGSAVLVVAGLVSAAVTWDRALAPRLLQPADRARFYDEVWGVDPAVTGWNTRQTLLYNTGYASLSYAGDYPLLGPSLARVLLTVDTGSTTQAIVRFMQEHGAQFAYVPASPKFQALVESTYAPDAFEVAHVSTVTSGKRIGTRRYLFRLRPAFTTRSEIRPSRDALR